MKISHTVSSVIGIPGYVTVLILVICISSVTTCVHIQNKVYCTAYKIYIQCKIRRKWNTSYKG